MPLPIQFYSMKTKLRLLFNTIAALMPSLLLIAAEGDPISRPAPAPPRENRQPEPLESLAKNPDYKRAPLMIEAASPLSPTSIQPGGTTKPQTRWQWHKNRMHFEALKRGGGTFKDLRETIVENSRPMRDPAKPMNDPANAQPDWFRGENEAQFERLDNNLTIFRFTNYYEFINNTPEGKKAAVALGKAFFWDRNFSANKQVACATCHYAAGTDHRTAGVVSLPANFGIHIPWPDFRAPKLEKDKYENAYHLKSSDLVSGGPEFDDAMRQAGIFDPITIAGMNVREVIGSPSLKRTQQKTDGSTGNPDLPRDELMKSINALKQHIAENLALSPAQKADFRKELADLEAQEKALSELENDPEDGEATKELNALMKRIHNITNTQPQVTPRNAGTVINAVFNSRNFHDSRASSIFNGHTGWGKHTDDAINKTLYNLRKNADGSYTPIFTWDFGTPAIPNPYFIANASLASQAVEPVVSDVEMSPRGRAFHHIAREMLSKPILDGQDIHAGDSSLSDFKTETYNSLIKKAFKDAWLGSNPNIDLPTLPAPHDEHSYIRNIPPNLPPALVGKYTQTEANFGLIWGIAIHTYLSTLISDNSPFDQEQRFIKRSARPALIDGQDGALKANEHQTQPYDPNIDHPPGTRPGTPSQPHNTELARPGKITFTTMQPLSASARRGRDYFRTFGCADCHAGAEFTAASWTELGLYSTGRDPFGPADPITPVDNLDDEEDIVTEAENCPPNKPLGVECMAFAGTMQSIYDGGNYNIGANRFIRPHQAPTTPKIHRVFDTTEHLNPKEFSLVAPRQPLKDAHYEDNGNGRFFMPLEVVEQTYWNPNLTMGDAVKKQAAAILKANHEALDFLAETLGSKPHQDGQPKSLNVLLTRQIAFSNTAEPTRRANQEKTMAETKDIDARLIIPGQVLNSTQQIARRSISSLRFNKENLLIADDPNKLLLLSSEANPLVASLTTELARIGRFLPSRLPGIEKVVWRVGPMTPVPESSLSRVWFDLQTSNGQLRTSYQTHLDEELRKPVPDRNQALITSLREQIHLLTTKLALRDLIDKYKNDDTLTDEQRKALIARSKELYREADPILNRIADAGSFKAPTLRNIELTGPYMHNGSLLTLEAVMDFYERGGHFNGRIKANDNDGKTGDLHPEMLPIPMSTEQKADIIAFLKSLTDERVRYQKAPFDHPSLPLVINTAEGATTTTIEAVGADGSSLEIPTFEDVLRGNRTH